MPRFHDLPLFPQAHYGVNVDWDALEANLERYCKMGLDLDPDFQRGHVWTEAQQRAYVEHVLHGGESGKEILFNHPGWMGSFKGDFVLVDGKQRLEAVRRFLRDDLRILPDAAKPEGYLRSEFDDGFPYYCTFIFRVMKLQTRAEVLQAYVGFNNGGSVHTAEEIDRVRGLLASELARMQAGQ